MPSIKKQPVVPVAHTTRHVGVAHAAMHNWRWI